MPKSTKVASVETVEVDGELTYDSAREAFTHLMQAFHTLHELRNTQRPRSQAAKDVREVALQVAVDAADDLTTLLCSDDAEAAKPPGVVAMTHDADSGLFVFEIEL